MPAHQPAFEELEPAFRALRQQFDALADVYRPALWRYSLRLTGSVWDAEDLTQDAPLKAFAQLSMLSRARDPRACLFRMASNLWIDFLRRRKPSVDLDEAADLPAAPPPAEAWRVWKPRWTRSSPRYRRGNARCFC